MFGFLATGAWNDKNSEVLLDNSIEKMALLLLFIHGNVIFVMKTRDRGMAFLIGCYIGDVAAFVKTCWRPTTRCATGAVGHFDQCVVSSRLCEVAQQS